VRKRLCTRLVCSFGQSHPHATQVVCVCVQVCCVHAVTYMLPSLPFIPKVRKRACIKATHGVAQRHTHTHKHTHARTRMHINIHTRIQTNTNVYTHIHTHEHIPVCAHTYIHIHIHSNTHRHTHLLPGETGCPVVRCLRAGVWRTLLLLAGGRGVHSSGGSQGEAGRMPMCISVCVRAYVCMCMCVCMCEQVGAHACV
jgi:hypothetical protein